MFISKIQTKTKHSPIQFQPCSNQKQFVSLPMLNSTPSACRPRGHPYPHIIYMAQSKSFFGLRRGSTKTLTFSVYNGKQVTKDRVIDVKNPRSAAQMKQRAIMATALHSYSALKEICDHSFEGVAYGQKSMNYFVAKNAQIIRSAAPNVNLSTFKGIAVSNAYVIAKGSLPPISFSSVEDSGSHQFRIPMVVSESGFTFGKLMENLGANTIGDMVTFVALVDNPGSSSSVYWLRLKLTEENKEKSINTTDDKSILDTLVEGTDFETNIDNFTTEDFAIVANGTSKYVYVEPDLNSKSQSLGIILSRKSDAGWLRSTSTMVNLLPTRNYNEALATYPESGEKILNGGNM